jgi:hypothetical protein
MRRLIPLLFALLACDVQPKVTLPGATKPVIEQVVVVTPVQIVSKRVPRHVTIIGDSEACAVGAYAIQVAKQINDENKEPHDVVAFACVNGTKVEYWSNGGAFKSTLEAIPDTDVVLLFLGTNNYWYTKAPDADVILKEVRDRELACVWVGPTAVQGRTWRVNQLLHDAVTPTCDYFDTQAAHIPLRDGIHPTGFGAIAWIRDIWPLIPPKYEDDCE